MTTMKCCQDGCELTATERVFWPGREPVLMCVDHCAKARRVGDAIGCYIHAESLPVAAPPEGATP